MKIVLSLVALSFAASMAHAQSLQQQQQSPPDPRVSGQMVSALTAMVNLREAQIRALTEDAQKREAEWAAYSDSLWRALPAPPEATK